MKGRIRQWGHRIDWPDCSNTRDLGGFPTQDNKQTRWRSFVRSDTLSRLTKHGQEMLAAFGVTTILDLRFPHETVKDPSPFQKQNPAKGSPRYFHLPMFDHDGGHLPSKKDLEHRDPLAAIYCGALDKYHRNIGRIFRVIVQHTQGTILFHCNSGQDRSGILSAFLLALAGVPTPVIAEDFALSTGYLRPMYQQMLTEPHLSPEKREDLMKRLKRILMPKTIPIFFSYLETQYGGVASFLKYSGVTEQDIEHLRMQLVE